MSASRRSRSRRLKRIVANILVVILGGVALLLLAGLFLPRRHRVDRSLDVAAIPAEVLARVTTGAEWAAWAAWPVEGMGTAGEGAGPARVRLVRVETNQAVDHVILVRRDGAEITWAGTLRIESRPPGTRLVWTLEGDMGRTPWARYQGFELRRRINSDLEASLVRLKERVEKQGGAAASGSLPKQAQ